jgi:hypothetical protein
VTIESGSASSFELWIGENDGVVYQVNMDGQILSYPTSNQIGSGLLSVFNVFVLSSQSLGSFQYQINQKTIVGLTEGWTLVSSEYTTFGIGGQTYPAYHIKIINVAHPEVSMQSLDVTLANILPNRWFYVSIFVQAKDGATFQEALSELTLSS